MRAQFRFALIKLLLLTFGRETLLHLPINFAASRLLGLLSLAGHKGDGQRQRQNYEKLLHR